jgi:hypothetical protein
MRVSATRLRQSVVWHGANGACAAAKCRRPSVCGCVHLEADPSMRLVARLGEVGDDVSQRGGLDDIHLEEGHGTRRVARQVCAGEREHERMVVPRRSFAQT